MKDHAGHSVAVGLDEQGTGSRESIEKAGAGWCWPEPRRDLSLQRSGAWGPERGCGQCRPEEEARLVEQ